MKNLSLRVPDDLREWLRIEAFKNSRSMNGEIIAMMKRTKNDLEKKRKQDAKSE